MNANFNLVEAGWKKHKNGLAHAIVLPTPVGKEDFATYDNLCIEYYFDEEYITSKIDEKGLELEATPIVEQMGRKVISKRIPTELHFHKIKKNTKKYFAETVVPTLPEIAFENFKLVFELVGRILNITPSPHQEETLCATVS